jgi:uracil-DNA glycosylase
MDNPSKLIKQIYHGYQESINLNKNAKYLSGAPLKPVVPLDTAIGELFILGAYPSARYAQINHIRDIPVADNLGPFEHERWFDGTRIRIQASAKELNDLFLNPLEIDRKQCWITNLVKVFLFKPGHRDKYQELNARYPEGYERERFNEIGKRSLSWLEQELRIAKPELMITLGREVAGILRSIESPKAQNNLLKAKLAKIRVGNKEVRTIHCNHPGILMRPNSHNPWIERHHKEFIPFIKKELELIKESDRTTSSSNV